jgi:hypothetical protein
VEPGDPRGADYSISPTQTKTRLFRAAHSPERAETHRLMRYCTVQFSRSRRCRPARFGPDH